ncbi:MAG: thioredoxin fold domain-containing protein [Cruoricaptor ignavus]|nr:thioredoxin fold domain-containing protein [Cruoricaptor ignavus]
MKKGFFIIFCTLSTFVFSQNSISFEDKSSFQEILSKAKKENKLVFMDAFAAWCGPCKLMEKNIFPKENVKSYYNTNFINARFDMEKGEGREIANRYGVRSYPTFLFLNGDGEVVYKGMGYLDETEFLSLGNEANSIAKGGSSKERFENGESNPEFLLNAIKLNANTDPEFAKRVSERYFAVKKNPEFTQDEVYILLHFLKSANEPNYKVFTKNKSEIVKILPENVYEQFDTQMKLSGLVEQSIDQSAKTINENLFLQEATKLVGEKEAHQHLNQLKISFYPAVGNFTEYEKIALDFYKDGSGFNADELNRVAFIFSENIQNLSSLKTATIWAEKSVMNGETPENTYILAKLYWKTGNKDAAKMFAEQSVKLTKRKGMDATVPEKLLSEIK